MTASGKPTIRGLIELTIGSDHRDWVSLVRPIDLFFLEDLLEDFDASDTLETDAVVVVHFEVNAEAEPDTLHELEGLLNLFIIVVQKSW